MGDSARIAAAARRVRESRARADVVVVVSAMGGETDRLLAACEEWGADDAREYDAVLASGEQICAGLTALALRKIGVAAKSFSGKQAGILTDEAHGKARILGIDTAALRAAVAEGITPVVAGFQGRAANGDTTTLGRGGSDTTAVALAAALAADECQIYTDVDGIHTTDPRVCEKARRLKTVHFEEMLEMASLGSKVLQPRAVAFAGKYRVPLRVLSSAEENKNGGTLVLCSRSSAMEEPIITGIAFNRGEAKITLVRVPDRPGVAGRLLARLGAENINVDMIVQNISHDGRTDFSFTVDRGDYAAALECARGAGGDIGAETVTGDEGIGKVSVVGVGMRSHAGVAAKMFAALAEGGINIQMISTSEIKISAVIEESRVDDAVRLLHDAFGLENGAEEETTQTPRGE